MISQPAIFSVADVTRRPRRRLAPSVPSILESARFYLTEAESARSAPARYVNAHLAALRLAAAVLAQRADPGSRPVRAQRPRSAWELLPKAAPELAEWAAFFDAGAQKRAEAEAGLSHTMTSAEADALLREVRVFQSVVESLLGLRSLRDAG